VPKKLVKALADGSIGVLNAATTCACAGIIVGVVTLTGLGLKFSSIVIELCRRQPAAHRDLHRADRLDHRPRGAGDRVLHHLRGDRGAGADQARRARFAAHMFIFYYAVLSEVSPPTALSPFAAAAITGGDPYKTTLQSWKYTLPAFLVPFVFVLDPQGVGLLLKIPKGGSWIDIVEITIKTTLGLWRWRRRPRTGRCDKIRRSSAACFCWPGLLLVFPSLIEAIVEGDHRPRHQLHGYVGPA
jgi:TRAP-type uncharacterized transport system fused permease subunit